MSILTYLPLFVPIVRISTPVRLIKHTNQQPTYQQKEATYKAGLLAEQSGLLPKTSGVSVGAHSSFLPRGPQVG